MTRINTEQKLRPVKNRPIFKTFFGEKSVIIIIKANICIILCVKKYSDVIYAW